MLLQWWALQCFLISAAKWCWYNPTLSKTGDSRTVVPHLCNIIVLIIKKYEEMNGVLDLNIALYGYALSETTWNNEINFGMKQAPGAG